jgi:hypothetical protein
VTRELRGVRKCGVACRTIGASGEGGGLLALIDSDGDVSNSSMSLTSVTATNNTAGTMRRALLSQRDLWVVPDCQWIPSGCVRTWVRDGGLSAVREQATLLRIGHAHGPGVRFSTTTTRPLMFSMAEAEVIVP